MPYGIVRLAVVDFDRWRGLFNEPSTLQEFYGSQVVRVFRSIDKPNQLVVLAEYQDLQGARQFLQSSEFQEATQRAGVTGSPHVMFAEEVHLPPA